MTQSDDMVVINMNPRWFDCSLCGSPTEHKWSVPVVNGDVVSNDFPDEIWHAHGGGVGVCEMCFDAHANGELPTFDRFYLHLRDGFSEGGGI